MNEPTITFVGNLSADIELRFTPVCRGFAISEVPGGGNRRVGWSR
jgi:single-stranded DNA-binding protein